MIDGEVQDYSLTLDKFLTHAAKWHPSSTVVTAVDDQHKLTTSYAYLFEQTRSLSVALRELGVQTGQRVATLAWNTQAHIEAWYSIMSIGAVCLTLNPRLTAEQLASMVVQAEASVLLVSSDQLAVVGEISAQAPCLKTVVVLDGDAPNWAKPHAIDIHQLSALRQTGDRKEVWGDFPETSPSVLCFTSGTTGSPKGVSYSHRSSFLHALRLLNADTMAISNAETVLVATPLFHANAWGIPLAAFASGANLVLPGRETDGPRLAKLIADENVTVCVGVPTVWLGLADYAEREGIELPSLKRIIVGGAPLPTAVMQRIENSLGVDIQTSWGMTELSPLGTITSPDETDSFEGASGRPSIGIDMLLTDAQGEALQDQRDNEGHLWVRGAAVIERYFGHQQAVTNAEGWFATGDLAKINAEGHLFITGRAKDLIKSGGEWINPAEIESHVAALPQISMVAVIGRLDAKWGERPILIIETRSGETVSDDTIFDHLRKQVPTWWVPDHVYRLDKMPLATTGKIDKIRLRADYATVDV